MALEVTLEQMQAVDPSFPAGEAGKINLVVARALSAAPCLREATDPQVLESARAIIIPAVLRWVMSPAGGDFSEQAGPFQQTLKVPGGLLWRSEIEELQALCSSGAVSVPAPLGEFPQVLAFPDPVEGWR